MQNKTIAALFELDDLLTAARQAAGVPEDFQDDDIIQPLSLILEDLRAGSAQLSETGAQGLQAQIMGGLVTRMQILHKLNQHPQVAQQPITAPIFITGLPRTGTTKLHRVLAATGLFQYLPLWKILSPLPASEFLSLIHI